MPLKSHLRSLALPLVAGVLLTTAACGDDGDGEAGGKESAPAAKSGAGSLAGVCPETVTVQTSWLPNATAFGPLYALLGDEPEVDADQKRATAPLVADGKDTGISLELRAGGPAIGFAATSAQMYTDEDIDLGVVGGFDEIVQLSATQPTTAVLALLEKDPTMIYWDPETYPEFETIEDVGKSGTTVLYSGGDTYMEYLTGTGILKKDQVDGSFDGSPARFVASGGKLASSGYAAEDPYMFENEIDDWMKPIKGQLVYEAGYPIYGPSLVVRPEAKAELAPCLEKLIPVIQQSQVDYLRDPDAAIATIVDIAEQYKGGDVLTEGIAKYGIGEMKKLGIASDDAEGEDTTVGNFETGRVQEIIDIGEPIFAEQKKPVKDGLKPADVVTNEFLDPAVGHGG
ncbi:hypothetical protein [Streptomyces sp. CMB-StM0423]|uniref:hypothetical protein n=1 Tax=Streptomyces sp. CMB-StM0423 TaxID=2059884 RepID=UPI000C70D5B5|nr:hypothetical protein [Streptomyces sp. CMB-StM0423]AUH39347.1 hypothetical protein CXR04_02945 [Streptomyces sp. CMB-StM0423]